MKSATKWLSLFFLLFLTWIVTVVHLATFPKGKVESVADVASTGKWYPKAKHGINHVVLSGNAFDRGKAYGSLTSSLLQKQENQLFGLLQTIIPSSLLRGLFTLGIMRWYWGADAYLEPWMTDEMLGVSLSGTHQWDHYADVMTRQVAYHGLHEVGQMFTDVAGESAGCTVFAIPEKNVTANGWVIGRNFDFEGGRIFDEEKIVKWVFPTEGNALVSIIWAGMVGTVTAVNEKGVYVSINAAGSTDFRRLGTPSTLVALKALQFGNSAREAVAIIEKSQMFITDIFLVADNKEVFRVEKSPKQVHTRELTEASVVTNHLHDPAWATDKINLFRRDKLTSLARENRGGELLKQINSREEIPTQMLRMMRDKNGAHGVKLHLGHRSAIDALIATHGVIYDSSQHRLYVSEGPSLVGAFRGYDLVRSFQEKTPYETTGLPKDPEVTEDDFVELKEKLKLILKAEDLLNAKRCEEAKSLWPASLTEPVNHAQYWITYGKLQECSGDPLLAKHAFAKAKELYPPYESQRVFLSEKLK